MGAKTEALARQLEEKARDAVATLEKLGTADWEKVTAAEKWTVGVTAHHLAGSLEAVAGIVTGIVSGEPPRGNFTRAMLDEMNAQHAKEHADCTRAETLALFQRRAATALAVVGSRRGLSVQRCLRRARQRAPRLLRPALSGLRGLCRRGLRVSSSSATASSPSAPTSVERQLSERISPPDSLMFGPCKAARSSGCSSAPIRYRLLVQWFDRFRWRREPTEQPNLRQSR
jgi:Mycothiol maleylpyruvate isomerase N-terminal domain